MPLGERSRRSYAARMVFTDAELAYLDSQQLGRLATLGADGGPQTRPVSFRAYADGTILIGGPANETTRKYKNCLLYTSPSPRD